MSRLPIPGQDSGTWGDILNDYLSQSLKPDGTLQDNSVTSNAVAPNSITNAQIASDAVNAASIADGSITNSLIADGTIQEVKLSSTVQTKLNQTAPVTSVNTKTGAVTLDKADIGLGNVDDTSDATKNAATATLTNKTLTNPQINKISDTNGNTSIQLNATASAVNYLYVVNSATGNSISFRANGTDTNIPIGMFSKGTGQVQLRSDTNGFILSGDSVASGVNYVGLTNAATGTGPTITSTGSDTNVDLNITAKGTGNLNIPRGTGLSQYNTADQTTNYERVRQYWSGNVFYLYGESGGTGTARPIRIISGNATFGINELTQSLVFTRNTPSVVSTLFDLTTSGTGLSGTGGSQYGVRIIPTINQSSTAGYTMLLINPTETATGSGTKLLIDAQVGGTSKFKVDNTGAITVAAVGTASGSLVSTDGTQTLTNKTISTPKVDNIKDTNGNTSIAFAAISNAVNYLTINNGPSGSPGAIGLYAAGTDSNINLNLFSKGSGVVTLRDGNNTLILSAQSVASAINYTKVLNAITGGSPTISAFSASDTNVSLALAGQGTGTVRLTSGATMPTGTSLTSYNTSDETTNYEKAVFRYSSNVLEVGHVYGGTGNSRVARFGTASTNGGTLNRYIQFQSSTPMVSYNWGGTVLTGQMINIGSGNSWTASSGNQTALGIDPTVNQSSTAGYTILLVNPTETATGSGIKLLADFQVGGTSKFKISNTGTVTATMAGADGMYITNTLTDTASGSVNGFNYIATINPASASSTQFRSLAMSATVPTSNSQTINYTYGGWFESRWQGSGSATTLIGVRANVVLPAAAQNFGIISNAIGLEAMGVNEFATTAITSGTITYAKGINVAANAKTSAGLAVTNAIGIDVQSQTIGSSLNVGIRVFKSDSYSIQLVDTGGTAAGGITFGTDTNLYRSAADTLKTDDAIIAAGKITTSGNVINVATAKTPSSASDTGTTGDIAWDNNYVYVCVATNTWKRSAISTW